MDKYDFGRYTGSEEGQRLLGLLTRDDIYARLLLDADEVCDIVPEAREMIGFDQRNPHHPYDVWVHTAHCVASSPPRPLLRLALLMHDIGKPEAFYMTEDEVGHFNRHDAKGEKITRERLDKIGFGEEAIEEVAFLVLNHDKGIPETEWKRWLDDFGEDRFRSLLDVKEADARSHDDKYKKIQLARVAELRRHLDELIDKS